MLTLIFQILNQTPALTLTYQLEFGMIYIVTLLGCDYAFAIFSSFSCILVMVGQHIQTLMTYVALATVTKSELLIEKVVSPALDHH